MVENELTTVYLRTSGIPYEWLAQVARQLVTDQLAATADISCRPDPDSGLDVLACLHTRDCHVEAIRSAVGIVSEMRAYPLECHDDYREWVLDHTRS